MSIKNRIISLSRWDGYVYFILFFTVIIQALKWRLLPIFIDVYYHLLTVAGFNDAGGWLDRCFWEFAPVGRPQLYPPLLHILMLFLLKMGVPLLSIGKLAQFLIYPLLLFVIWYVIREIFDKKIAFFSLLMIFPLYSFYLTAIITLAASLSLIFCLLSLLFLERNKILTSALLFSLAFYTHGFTPWLFFCVFVLYGVLFKERLKSCLKVCLLTLFFSCPIIFYQIIMSRFYVFQRNLGENFYIEINLLHWAMFLFGLVTCIKKKGRYYIFVSLFFVFIILLIGGFIFRYFSFYGIMTIVFMNAIFFSSIYDKLSRKNKKVYLTVIIFLFFVLSPTLSMDLLKKDKTKDIFDPSDKVYNNLIFKKDIFTLNLFDSSLSNFIFYCSRQIRSNEVTIFFPRVFLETANVIVNNSAERDIIWSNFPYTAGILSLLSHRVTSSAMLLEVKPYKNFDQIHVSKLIIWQKDPFNIKQEPVGLIKKYQLKKIADTKLAFIYENPGSIFKKQTLTAAISYKILFILVFLIFTLTLWSVKFGVDKY